MNIIREEQLISSTLVMVEIIIGCKGLMTATELSHTAVKEWNSDGDGLWIVIG